MTATWILIANASHARLLQRDAAGRLSLLKSWEHPASRKRSSVLGKGRAGHGASGHGYGGVAFEPRLADHDKQALAFAGQLAGEVEEGVRHDRCGALEIFASSPFLGELKQELGDATRRLPLQTHDVDLTSVGIAELERRMAHARAQPES